MVSRHFILIALIGSFLAIGYIFQSYLMSITIGAILAIATRPIYEALYTKLNFSYKRVIISSFLTLILFLFVFLPLIYFVGLSYQFIPSIGADQAMQYTQNLVAYLKNLPKPFDVFQESINVLLGEFDIYNVNIDVIKSILNNVAQFFWKINGIVYQFFLILFFYFLFNIYGYNIFILTTRLLPIVKRFKRILYSEFSNTISSVFFSTVFSMVTQGIAFGLFLYFTTDYDAFYVGMSVGFATAIPVIGAYLVIVPLIIIELLNQNYLFAGIIVLFTTVVLSGLIDNILRLLFMKYLSKKFSLHYKLNELFILLAMLAGIGVFGGWGIIIGPAILSLCVAFILIYVKSKINSSE
ncbi:MAG: AI-2E family transporter [Arcobacteraceae bacterium]|nr:AI-2E family transporter [Arcobacteraceae bacterium]MDY0326824.1 AI-2E family transporter [Arcobacteraceae bacterium]